MGLGDLTIKAIAILAAAVALLAMAILGFAIFLAATLLSTAVGAFIGWIVSHTFLGGWVITGFSIFGLDVAGKLVELGAMLGFLTGFFRSKVSIDKKKD